MKDETLKLASALIERPSITPEDGGCQEVIASRLAHAGFKVQSLQFGKVTNLWAIAGERGPLICFAGHTDVVPTGPIESWSSDPFTPCIDGGWLYGRGAADMKSSVAAMTVAVERFRAAHVSHYGRLAVLLTSDEEGPAIDGTRAVLEWLGNQGTFIDYCVVGEPSSINVLGDTIRIGRRGSLDANLRVLGTQGHVAYPNFADNALHRLTLLLSELVRHKWDDGDYVFPPSSFQISNAKSGTGANNVIPGFAEAQCNWRFNTNQSEAIIKAEVEARCADIGISTEEFEWNLSATPYVSQNGRLLAATCQILHKELGRSPELSTGGGTSDGQFFASTGAEVIELGPINSTIHQPDERVRIQDITALATLYQRLAEHLLC